MPYFVYTDADGEQVALPCTERLYTERQAVQVASYRVMPLLSLRGRPEVRLGGFTSLAGTPLAGFWAPVEITPRHGRRRCRAASPRPRSRISRNRSTQVADTPLPDAGQAAGMAARRRPMTSTRCWPA